MAVPAFGSRAAGGSGRASRAAVVSDDLAPHDEALFERLRQWRVEVATERGVPSYVVFNDKTLRAIASARPETEDQMLAVSGVGPAKWEAYGDAVLAMVAEAE